MSLRRKREIKILLRLVRRNKLLGVHSRKKLMTYASMPSNLTAFATSSILVHSVSCPSLIEESSEKTSTPRVGYCICEEWSEEWSSVPNLDERVNHHHYLLSYVF